MNVLVTIIIEASINSGACMLHYIAGSIHCTVGLSRHVVFVMFSAQVFELPHVDNEQHTYLKQPQAVWHTWPCRKPLLHTPCEPQPAQPPPSLHCSGGATETL